MRLHQAAARHRGLIEVVALGAVIRWTIDVRNVAGVYQDSLTYIRLSRHAPFGPYSPTRPSGYPLVLRLIRGIAGPSLDHVTAIQHAAGLVVGIVVYALLTRAGVRRWLATAAAAIVIIDAYAIALEQDILAESIFTVTFTVAVFLTLRPRVGPLPVGIAGALIALSAMMRTVALVAVPTWLVWLLWAHVGRRALLVGASAVLLPLLMYSTLHAAAGDGFGLVVSDGWYLYAKLGPVVDCNGASIPAGTKALCVRPISESSNAYLYDSASPARRLFMPDPTLDPETAMNPRTNGLLRRFSVGVIARHPLKYFRVVALDFFHYLGPAKPEGELSLYGPPSSLSLRFEQRFHTQWWLMAPLAAAGLAGALYTRRRRELSLLVGTAVSLLVGASALSGFNIRYLIPVVPLIVAGGLWAVDLAITGVTAARRQRWRRGGDEEVGRSGEAGETKETGDAGDAGDAGEAGHAG